MKKNNKTVALLIAILLQLLAYQPTLAEASKEYQIKAAMIYQFIQFVSWPEAVPAGGSVNLCIMGSDPFGAALAPVEKQSLNGAAIKVIRNVPSSKAGSCHVLFLAQSESAQLNKIVAELKDKPVLTVSEAAGFADNGGMIGFVSVQNKIKFEINNAAARQAKLRIDAQVLELAQRVVDK